MAIDYNQFKLSKFVDDFFIDNINNMTSDSCHVNKLKIEQYFPWNGNIDFNNLKIDNVGKYSITLPKKADNITRIILSHCSHFNKQITITDATAGVGGNVLSFYKNNMIVNAVELDQTRFQYLSHNINEYGYNISLHNADYTHIYDNLRQDVIFIDPPWGGTTYKQSDEVNLKLGDLTIEQLCNNIIDKKLAFLTVLKLPFNYNINYIKEHINNSFTIYKLKNILLIIISNIN